jgi:hypothetical protein
MNLANTSFFMKSGFARCKKSGGRYSKFISRSARRTGFKPEEGQVATGDAQA